MRPAPRVYRIGLRPDKSDPSLTDPSLVGPPYWVGYGRRILSVVLFAHRQSSGNLWVTVQPRTLTCREYGGVRASSPASANGQGDDGPNGTRTAW